MYSVIWPRLGLFDASVVDEFKGARGDPPFWDVIVATWPRDENKA